MIVYGMKEKEITQGVMNDMINAFRSSYRYQHKFRRQVPKSPVFPVLPVSRHIIYTTPRKNRTKTIKNHKAVKFRPPIYLQITRLIDIKRLFVRSGFLIIDRFDPIVPALNNRRATRNLSRFSGIF
jgi:hypothetical protein